MAAIASVRAAYSRKAKPPFRYSDAGLTTLLSLFALAEAAIEHDDWRWAAVACGLAILSGAMAAINLYETKEDGS
jgi:hypothetical protein